MSAMSMPIVETFSIKAMHLIQKSDFIYWVFGKFFQSQLLELVGILRGIYKGFTPKEKELAQEMLDVMHPLNPRRRGTIHMFEIKLLDSVSMSKISAPTLILHAKDDKLMDYKHTEFAHRNIKQSKLISFETGGHALLTRFKEVRKHVRTFLSDKVGSWRVSDMVAYRKPIVKETPLLFSPLLI